MSKTLSTRELARALGVSASSVRRWVDAGALPSTRTAGGHRRVALEDALRFARDQGLAWSRPEVLLPDLERAESADPPEAFRRALLAGDEDGARGIALNEFVAGRTVAELCDGFIRPAMHGIGALWHGGTNGILLEHRATSLCTSLLHSLSDLLPRGTQGRALGGAIEGDDYVMPSLMASIVLQAEDFQTTNLGPDVPIAVLREAVAEEDPELVWISVSELVEPDRLREQLARFLREQTRAGRAVVLGGRKLGELALPRVPRAHFAGCMAELRALALGLQQAAGGRAG